MSVFSLNDPYWTLGPAGEQLYGLPPPLTRCPRPVIEVYRSATAFCSIVAALLCYATLQQVVVVALGPRLFGSRAQLWHQPDVFGPFGAVLDRGLGGFWGTWWHQTFRVGFSAPTEWMVRVGLLRPSGTAAALVATFVAFAQSGIMHAAGSFTTVPETWAWAPFIFFLLQFVGIAVEQALWAGVRRGMAAAGYEKGLPMRWKRVANFAFVAVWLHMTRPVLVDDFTRCGLFLFEAVPVSPARAVGLGKGSDRAIWRGAQFIPGWHSGTHWWESGFKS